MCNKRNTTMVCSQIDNMNFRVDNCIANLIYVLRNRGIKTLACCCGHGKYNISIVYKSPNGKIWDLISGVQIPRKKRFYVKDKEGYYNIPEVLRYGTWLKQKEEKSS